MVQLPSTVNGGDGSIRCRGFSGRGKGMKNHRKAKNMAIRRNAMIMKQKKLLELEIMRNSDPESNYDWYEDQRD